MAALKFEEASSNVLKDIKAVEQWGDAYVQHCDRQAGCLNSP